MNLGFEFVGAKPKGQRGNPEPPTQQRMTQTEKIRRNPDTDSKRIRHQQARRQATKETTMTEADLIAKMASATTLQEQRGYAAQLAAIREAKVAKIRDDASLDLGVQVVGSRYPTHSTVAFTQHTAASDWIGEIEPDSHDSSRVESLMRAEAAVWFRSRPDFVKTNESELRIQAIGMAGRLASQFGADSPEAARVFMTTVGHLHLIGMDEVQKPPYQPPEGSSLPVAVDNDDTFDDSLSTPPDPKSNTNTGTAPSLGEGASPAGDTSASVENPAAGKTYDNSGGNGPTQDYLNGTQYPWVDGGPSDDSFSDKGPAPKKAVRKSAGDGDGPTYKCTKCGQTANTDDLSVIGRNCPESDFNDAHDMVSIKKAVRRTALDAADDGRSLVYKGVPYYTGTVGGMGASIPDKAHTVVCQVCGRALWGAQAYVSAWNTDPRTAICVWDGDDIMKTGSVKTSAAARCGTCNEQIVKAGDGWKHSEYLSQRGSKRQHKAIPKKTAGGASEEETKAALREVQQTGQLPSGMGEDAPLKSNLLLNNLVEKSGDKYVLTDSGKKVVGSREKTAKITTAHIVDASLAWENGTMPQATEARFFQHLIDTGLATRMGERYSQRARGLIVAGVCHVADGVSSADGSNSPSLQYGDAPEGDHAESFTQPPVPNQDHSGGDQGFEDLLNGTMSPAQSSRHTSDAVSGPKPQGSPGPFPDETDERTTSERYGEDDDRDSDTKAHDGYEAARRVQWTTAGEVPEAFKKQWKSKDGDDKDDDDMPDFIKKKIKESRRYLAADNDTEGDSDQDTDDDTDGEETDEDSNDGSEGESDTSDQQDDDSEGEDGNSKESRRRIAAKDDDDYDGDDDQTDTSQWRPESAEKALEHKNKNARRHTAADDGGSTCSVCGDAIEKDPAGEDPQTWHHDNGEKHDHEAKPGSKKESRRRVAVQPASGTCSVCGKAMEQESDGSWSHNPPVSDDDHEAKPGSSKESSRRVALDKDQGYDAHDDSDDDGYLADDSDSEDKDFEKEIKDSKKESSRIRINPAFLHRVQANLHVAEIPAYLNELDTGEQYEEGYVDGTKAPLSYFDGFEDGHSGTPRTREHEWH